jgi:DNA modification methylase
MTTALALASVDTFLDQVVECDALTLLRSLPAESIHCIVTSPPYYGLRNYNVPGQIGLEDTPERYVQRLVLLFREARRVLRGDGTLWLNLGDSYATHRNDHKGGGFGDNAVDCHSTIAKRGNFIPPGLKPKDLIGIPWRMAFALQADGWWLRSDIIWHKPNTMPESVTDRPTKAHEYVFLLTKSADYWYDADAIREPHKPYDFKTSRNSGNIKGPAPRPIAGHDTSDLIRKTAGRAEKAALYHPAGANKRTVWTVNSEPSPFPHFAMFPQKLIEPMILAGCPAQICSACGAGYERVVHRSGGTIGHSWVSHDYDLERGKHDSLPGLDNRRDKTGEPYSRRDLGFRPTCSCAAPVSAGIVLDMFMGSGTTALVAQRLGRHFIGSDLNPDYVKLARERIAYHGDDTRLLKEQAAGVKQLALFAEGYAHG